MTFQSWAQIALFVGVLVVLAVQLGNYMARLYAGEPVLLTRLLARPERLLYRLLRVSPASGQDWKAYARSLLIFSAAGWLLLYLVLRTQDIHPWSAYAGTRFHSGSWDLTLPRRS